MSLWLFTLSQFSVSPTRLGGRRSPFRGRYEETTLVNEPAVPYRVHSPTPAAEAEARARRLRNSRPWKRKEEGKNTASLGQSAPEKG